MVRWHFEYIVRLPAQMGISLKQATWGGRNGGYSSNIWCALAGDGGGKHTTFFEIGAGEHHD